MRRALFRAHRGAAMLHRGSLVARGAHVGIGLTEPRHRHYRVVRREAGHRQDIVLSVVHSLHQSSSARGGFR
jgi:hypothetical protein